MNNTLTLEDFICFSLLFYLAFLTIIGVTLFEIVEEIEKTKKLLNDWGKYLDSIWTDEPLTCEEKRAQEALKPKD